MSIKIKYYGKLLEELKLATRGESQELMPTILTEEDVPRISKILNFLNNKDKDILFLIFISGKTQTDLVRLINRSQPSISYDINKIKERIQFICELHNSFDMFTVWLQNHSGGFKAEQVMILSLMYFTSSFSQSARVLKLKPTRVRYVFDKTLKEMGDEEEHHEIKDLFLKIRNNLNKLRREYLRRDK